jgi:CelD/BcsL family acetyltransferase involved in cellulose biosynthesis
VTVDLDVRIYKDLSSVETEWRHFERVADCTAFQTFDWLSTWQRHVGKRRGVRPAVTIGCFGDGAITFMLPLAVEPRRMVRRLIWLGQDLCDYNAPLLAPNFSERFTAELFLAVWYELQQQVQHEPSLRYDCIEFEKMPEKVGAQTNPFTHLKVTRGRFSAHMTDLSDDWEKFYRIKRSSVTRSRDRTKRRRMAKYGEIRLVTATDADDARRTLEMLLKEKSRSLARKGLRVIFARPGYREFYLDLATNPKTQYLVHISRVEVGNIRAAANLGIVFRDCYYHVLASYADSKVAHFGPGALHLRELMAHAITLRLRRFDFTIGDEPYKLDWSESVLKLYDYSATTTWRGLPARWSSIVRWAKQMIKQTPALWALALLVRSIVRRAVY